MPNLKLNDVELYYEIHGQGEPLVLIAGLASDSQSWQPIIEQLSCRFQIIVFDNRGVGRTSPQEVEISIQQLADDCAALIKHLDLTTVQLLGHSMGGLVALDIAKRYPALVRKLILAGISIANSSRNNELFSHWAQCLKSGMDKELWYQNIYFWLFGPHFFEDETAVDNAVRFAIEYPYPQSAVGFENQVKAIAGFNFADDLSRISSQTLVISGEEDLLFPPESVTRLVKMIPAAESCLIEHAAHSLHWEQPQAFVKSVLEFLLGHQPE